MQPAERISLIRRAAAALAELHSTDMELALEEFGFELSDPRNFDSNYEYAVYHLKRGNDAALLGIDRTSCLQIRAKVRSCFISHTSANKLRAAKLAEVLARYGVAGFVAHDAIEPTREWQTEIEKALATCDALCALVTSDFVESRWCDQEVGFVMARRKLIVPLSSARIRMASSASTRPSPSASETRRGTSRRSCYSRSCAAHRLPTRSRQRSSAVTHEWELRRDARSGRDAQGDS